MPDDEPLDDARAVGTAAAAAAARVTESVARHVSEAKARERAALERAQDQQRAKDALSQLEDRTTSPGDAARSGAAADARRDIDHAVEWAAAEDPKALAVYELDRGYADTPGGRDSADRALVHTWKNATHGYDSTEQRGKRDAAREEAGVPLEGRRVVAVADQMNAQDPTLAAAVGKAQGRRARAAVPVQDRSRGR